MRPLLLALAAGIVACREPAPPATSTVVDSGGVQVVTSDAPAWGERAKWKVAGASLTLGGVAGDSALDFLGIVGARRLPDGSLVVANGGTRELRWFSPAGKHVRTIGGRRGSSPGTFAALTAFYALGDTLVVWDGRARVLSRFSASGDMLRRDTLRLQDSLRIFGVVGLFSDGGSLAEAGAPLELKDLEPGFVRPGRTLFRFSAGGVADSIGLLPGEQLLYSKEGRGSLSAVPFGLGSRLTVLPDGYIASEGDRLQLEDRDVSGRLRRIIRWPGSRVPVSTDDIDSQGRKLLGSAGTGMQRAQLDSIWRGIPKPDSLPAIIALMADPASLVWARRGGHVNETEAQWWVFGKDGGWLGSVALPAGASPLDISDEWIVLRTADENRIERIEVRRLRR